MRHTKYIILFTVLILTILVTRSSNAETTCTENELGDQTCVTTTTTNVPGVTTDNLLSPNFQDGSWNYSSNMTFHGSNTLATTHNSSADSTVSLSTDGGLTKSQINSGFTSTFGLDIWFWSGSTSNVTMKQTLTDDNGSVITQQRIITGTNNTYGTNYTDTITVNANTQSDYSIKAELSNTTPAYTTGHYGPDIDDPSLVVTTNSTTSTSTSETFLYCYERVPNACTYDDEALKDIEELKTDDGKTYDQYVEDAIEDFEVVSIETSFVVEDDFGKIEEFKIEDYAVETFNNFIEANDLTETFETALIEEDLGKEEFFDTMTDSIKEEFGEDFDMGGDDFKEDLTTEGGPSDLTEDTVEIKEEETVETETDTNDIKESNDTTTETEVEETPNESNTESETSEDVSSESDVDKNSETEGTETETDADENVETKETTRTELATDSIDKKVERVIAKVLAKLETVEDKVQAIQFVKIQGINASGPSLNVYKRKTLKDNVQLNGVPNPDFFNQLNIEQQQVYTNVNLNVYTNNDPLTILQNELDNINVEKNRLLLEIQQLKRG
jgi:hypothetical protein